MAIYQIFVRLLDGKTKCLQVPSPTISGQTLKQDVLKSTGIPLRFQRLTTGSQEIANETLIHASEDGIFPSCNLLLRLRGGKGGFGSLLRGAATKAGQKKTNNFDACRDMSGRRLRHVNAEKKLEEWKAEAEGRKLEKIAEQFLKKKTKEVRKSSSAAVDKYVAKYKEDSEKCMEKIDESVRQSMSLYVKSKRKILPLSGPASKRSKIWSGKKKVGESDSEESGGDSDDDSDEKSVVLDTGNHKEEDGSSGSVSGCQSDGEASTAQINLEEENALCNIGCLEYEDASGGEVANADSDGSSKPQNALCVETIVDNVIFSCSESLLGSNAVNLTMEGSVEPKDKVEMTMEELNFDKFNSATEMEVLGMEKLKIELQSRGLKCGGTLQERAARLFLLKSTPVEKLPKKLLAKPPSIGGKK